MGKYQYDPYRCVFCRSKPVKWTYSTRVTEDTAEWAFETCDFCHGLIEREQWSLLQQRIGSCWRWVGRLRVPATIPMARPAPGATASM